jgi:hypothetical protein
MEWHIWDAPFTLKVISYKKNTYVDEFRQLLETLRERSTLDHSVG